MSTERIRHYDIARGLGIILVVIGHSAIELGHYLIYMFHMPLFFFLSGVFFRSDSNFNMIRKQCQRLLLPLMIFIGIIFLISMIIGEPASLSLKAPHLNGLVGPLWFLVALFIVSVTYNGLKLRLANRLPLLLIVALLFSILGYIADLHKITNYMYIFSSMSVLVFYALGDLYSKNIIRSMTKRKHSVYLFIAVSFVSLFGLFFLSTKILFLNITDLFSNLHSENFVIWLTGAISGTLLIISVSVWLDSNVDIIAKIVAAIGEYSLYIFAFHLTIIQFAHRMSPYHNIWVEIVLIASAISISCFSRPILKRVMPQIFK